MTKKELIDKIENVYEMIITFSGRMFRIRRDEEDCLHIEERSRKDTEKHSTDINQMMNRYKIDGKPLRDYADAIRIIKYTALLDA